MNTKKLLLLLFLLAFVVRLVVLLGIVYGVPPSIRQLLNSPDAEGYSRVGWDIAQYWHGVLKEKPSVNFQYSYFSAIIYYLIGYNPLIIRMISCFFGAMSVIFVYFIARDIFDKKVAVLSSIFCALFPSMLFWQVYNLKEASYMFCVISVTWIVVKLQTKQTKDKKMDFIYILLTIPLLFYLHFLKKYLFIFFAYAVILSFFVTIRKKMAWRNLIYGVCFIMIFGVIGNPTYSSLMAKPVKIVVETIQRRPKDGKAEVSEVLLTFSKINSIRKGLATGNSVYRKNVDVSSPRKAAVFLPTGMTYFLLAPFPWQTKGLLQHLTIPETLIWYLMVPFMLYGLFYALRFKWREITCILIYLAIIIVLYSITLPNMGTFYRQRVAIIPFCLIFASIGIVHFSQLIAFKRKKRII